MKQNIDFKQWDIISLEKATEYTENWQTTNSIKAFLFHRNEIDCIRREQAAEKVHFYMGLNDATVEMIAVGATAVGQDIIGNSKNSKVYNFAMPCPSTCDILSPLYHGAKIASDPIHFRTPPDGLSCIERLQEISMEDAFTWTLAWQEKHDIKSFMYDLEQLSIAMNMTNSSSVRIYFGLDDTADSSAFSIMVGVDEYGKDDITQLLQVNKTVPCSKNNKFASHCDQKSPLYHDV